MGSTIFNHCASDNCQSTRIVSFPPQWSRDPPGLFFKYCLPLQLFFNSIFCSWAPCHRKAKLGVLREAHTLHKQNSERAWVQFSMVTCCSILAFIGDDSLPIISNMYIIVFKIFFYNGLGIHGAQKKWIAYLMWLESNTQLFGLWVQASPSHPSGS